MSYIEICGGIAYGKTTLAHLIGELGFQVMLEDFQSNPFYLAFYENPSAFAFEAELTFSLQHYHVIKRLKKTNLPFCVDFSPYLDLAYSMVTLEGTQRRTYTTVYDHIRSELGDPYVLLRVHCPPHVAHERILRRGRSAELGIEVSYLEKLDAALSDVVSSVPANTRVVHIDSYLLDFANDAAHRRQVLETVRLSVERLS